MAILLSVLSFIVSFCALWFAAEVAKRTDVRSKKSVKPHMMPVQESLKRAESQIRELSRQLADAQREIKILRSEQAAAFGIPERALGLNTRAVDLDYDAVPRASDSFYPTGGFNA